MKTQSNISLIFTLIILLLIGQGIFSLTYLNSITSQAENLYQHPYAVSNAARDISIHLISMHRNMKDIVLAENEQKIKTASALVDEHEKKALKNFDVIFDRYLGENSDIQSAYKAFIDWKVIRDEAIFLKTTGKYKDAADITRNKGADHVALLTQETQRLIDFADKKAKTFIHNTVEAKKDAFIIVITLLVATVITSVFSSYHAVRRLHSVQQEMKSRIHLIDQNILIAHLDKKGIVLDISNHLCRYLGVTKSEIIGKQSDFFINDTAGDIQAENIYKTILTGKSWEGEIRRVNAEGVTQWIYSIVHPELNEDHFVQGYVNIINDVTDQELSITDPLTGLHNRRYFDNIIKQEVRIAKRYKTFLTFVIIDIDYFKRYNDHYGHPAGDSALINVAQALQESMMRPNDYVFRLGGEEFAIIFSSLNTEQTIEFLETIRNRIEKLEIKHCKSDVSEFLTISLGAHINKASDVIDSNQLYNKADQALYEAKNKRNCVVVS